MTLEERILELCSWPCPRGTAAQMRLELRGVRDFLAVAHGFERATLGFDSALLRMEDSLVGGGVRGVPEFRLAEYPMEERTPGKVTLWGVRDNPIVPLPVFFAEIVYDSEDPAEPPALLTIWYIATWNRAENSIVFDREELRTILLAHHVRYAKGDSPLGTVANADVFATVNAADSIYEGLATLAAEVRERFREVFP